MNVHEVDDRRAMGYLATKPTIVVTTLHASGIVNAGVFGAYTNLSAEHIGIAVHKESHTYANMRRAGEFVVNVPGADLVKAIAVLADDIPPERSELDEAGLTARPGRQVAAPSIAECVAAVEFRFEQEVPVAGHSFMIGRCVGGWIRKDCLDDDGKINIFAARVFKDFKYPKPLYVLPGEVIEG